MKRSWQIAARKDRTLWVSLALGLGLFAALLALVLSAPRRAWSQDDGMEDAGDEEMLTGEPSQPAVRRPTAPGEEGPAVELSYATRLERTAVWVGDPFHYQILVDHSPNIEFVLQNLNKDTLLMEPLKVLDVTCNGAPCEEAADSSVLLKNGNKRLIVDITLTSFTVGEPEQVLPQLTLFYFRKQAGNITAEEQAAQSLTIPGPTIGLRSTLPEEAADLRDAITVTSWARSRWIVAGVGWVALIALVAGAGWEGALAIRYRKGRRGPDPRKAMAAINDRWSQAVPMDFSDSERVLDFYGHSYKDLKEYLSYLLEVPTEGLTSEDVQGELGRLAANPDLTERATRVLATCEAARYARNGSTLDSESARALENDMRQIFHIGSKS